MRTALYYPHTTIQRESLLRMALLLWDRIEVIVPWPEFRPQYQDRLMAEAFELIGHAHFPSERAKTEAHKKVLDLIDANISTPFLYEVGESGYTVYSEKFLPETWHELRQARLSHHGSFGEEGMTRPMGLALMNILADCCAGKTRARITDEQGAYRNIVAILSADKRRAEGDEKDREFLVPRVVKVLDTDRIPIQDLIAFRRREETETKGAELRALRHRYREHVEKFIKEMNQLEDPSDVTELRRQYIQDAQDDVALLKQELGNAQWEAVFARDILTLATVGESLFLWLRAHQHLSALFTGLGTSLGSIGGVLGVRNRYLKSRRDTLNRHPMAYLYEVQRKAGSRFPALGSFRKASLKLKS